MEPPTYVAYMLFNIDKYEQDPRMFNMGVEGDGYPICSFDISVLPPDVLNTQLNVEYSDEDGISFVMIRFSTVAELHGFIKQHFPDIVEGQPFVFRCAYKNGSLMNTWTEYKQILERMKHFEVIEKVELS